MEDDDQRTFRVSDPLPPLEEWLVPLPPLPQNPSAFKPSRKKQLLLDLGLGLLPVLFGLAGAEATYLGFEAISAFLMVLAFFGLLITLALGVEQASSRANRWRGFGILLVSVPFALFCCYLVILLSLGCC